MHVSLLALTFGVATANIGPFLLAAMNARGYQVSVLACDGIQYHCVFKVYHAAAVPNGNVCQACRENNGIMIRRWTLDEVPTLWTSRYISADEDLALHERIPPDTSLEDILAFEWQGLPMGRWVIPALRIEYLGERWWMLPDVAARARFYLISAIRAAIAAERYIEAEKPDVMLIYDGVQPVERAVWNVARSKGVACVLYAVGQDSETIFLRKDKPTALFDFGVEWAEWRDVPLTPEEEARLDAYLAARQAGNAVESAFSPARQGQLQDLAGQLGLQPDRRPVITVLPSVAADFVVDLSDRELFPDGPAFETSEGWLQNTVALAARHPEADWVIRAHPGELLFQSRDTVLEMVERMPGGLPSNVRFIPTESPVSTFDLLALTRVLLTFHSTTGMEAAALGLPVVCAGMPHYRNLGFVWHPATVEAYEEMVERLLVEPVAPPEAVTLVRRYLYLWFIRSERRAALLKVVDRQYTRLYQGLSWLKPGRDPELDVICNYIAGEGPFIPLPARP